MKSSFSKHVKCDSTKWACDANPKFIDCVFEKRFFTYVHIHIYIHIYEGLFIITGLLNLALGLQYWFLDWRLMCFGKKPWYVYIYICTYLWSALFLSISAELGIGIAILIFGLALNVFWKKALLCIYIYTYMYIFMKRSFPKHNRWTWHWYCKFDFSIDSYHVLERSSSYVSAYVFSKHYIVFRKLYMWL